MTRSLGALYKVPVRKSQGWEPFSFAPGDDRAGLLGQAGFLAMYSHSGRSSPTLRGRAIREVLGAAIATDEVIAAWGAAYQQLADILIGAEAAIYEEKAQAPGGWRGARPFIIVKRVVDAHGGRIDLSNRREGGLVATIVLPRSHE